jgi:hypothetical protein
MIKPLNSSVHSYLTPGSFLNMRHAADLVEEFQNTADHCLSLNQKQPVWSTETSLVLAQTLSTERK